MLPGLFNSQGGYNYQAIETVLNIYGISDLQRMIYFDWSIICLNAISEIRAEKQGK